MVSGRLVYVVNCSLDGYIEDAEGGFSWSEPDDELHQFFNDLLRPIGTFLYGRRLYETMAVWETDPSLAAESPVMADFAAVWQDADKIVYSTTLEAPATERTRIERDFEPDAVRGVKAAAATDLVIGNATLTAHACRSTPSMYRRWPSPSGRPSGRDPLGGRARRGGRRETGASGRCPARPRAGRGAPLRGHRRGVLTPSGTGDGVSASMRRSPPASRSAGTRACGRAPSGRPAQGHREPKM